MSASVSTSAASLPSGGSARMRSSRPSHLGPLLDGECGSVPGAGRRVAERFVRLGGRRLVGPPAAAAGSRSAGPAGRGPDSPTVRRQARTACASSSVRRPRRGRRRPVSWREGVRRRSCRAARPPARPCATRASISACCIVIWSTEFDNTAMSPCMAATSLLTTFTSLCSARMLSCIAPMLFCMPTGTLRMKPPPTITVPITAVVCFQPAMPPSYHDPARWPAVRQGRCFRDRGAKPRQGGPRILFDLCERGQGAQRRPVGGQVRQTVRRAPRLEVLRAPSFRAVGGTQHFVEHSDTGQATSPTDAAAAGRGLRFPTAGRPLPGERLRPCRSHGGSSWGSWGPPAFSPRAGLLYVTGKDGGITFTAIARSVPARSPARSTGSSTWLSCRPTACWRSPCRDARRGGGRASASPVHRRGARSPSSIGATPAGAAASEVRAPRRFTATTSVAT